MKIVFKIGRSKGDPEKAVFPALIFISAKHNNFNKYNHLINGFMLCLGWWDFGIKLGFYWKLKQAKRLK